MFAIDHDSDGMPNTNGCFWDVEGPISPATYGLSSGQAPTHNDEVAQLSIVAALAVVTFAVINTLRRRTTV